MNLDLYMIDDIKMEWLEAYAESLSRHIEAVREAGKKLGVSEYQLDHHDDSKYFIMQFAHYARQFHGDAGDPHGFARAWLNHIHLEPHHWQHWIFPDDYTPRGSSVECGVMEMPEKYALEMIADWQGSSFCYTGAWDMTEWLKKNSHRITLHSKTNTYVKSILSDLGYDGIFKSEADE